MNDEQSIPKRATTEACHLGNGIYATFDSLHIIIELGGVSRIAIDPPAFIELMRFARKHMGQEVFREIDRMAGGGR